MNANQHDIKIYDIIMRVRDLPLCHRAELLAEQLNELCLELNIELSIRCDSAAMQVCERTGKDDMAFVESFQGLAWISFDPGLRFE